LTIAGQTFTVSQAGASGPSCTYTIKPTEQNIGAGGGAGTPVALATAANCAWNVSSNASWITLTSAASGTGNATVTFNVAANQGGARSGTLTIAGQTFTVSQAGAAACSYSIKPSSDSGGPAASTGTVAVAAAGGCQWTAVSNVSWMTITSGATGNGNGSVGYSVAANTGGARTGTLTIAGLTFSFAQSAACTYQISPTSQTISASGGSGTRVSVTTASACQWSATSNVPWITITSDTSETGNGHIDFNVAPNVGAARTGTLTIAGHTFTVSQQALLCEYSISPTQRSIGDRGGDGDVDVDAPTGCAWTAVSEVSWITITSGASGTGDGRVRYQVDRNRGSQRTGRLIIAGRVFTITQDQEGE